MGVPCANPRRMLRAATGGSPRPPATLASSWRDLALGPMCRWHVSAGATACLPPGPGGAGHLGSQGGRRNTQPAGCGSGGLHWGAVHSLLAPASRWLLTWGVAPLPRWSPTTKQVLQQRLSAPCPGCGTCSRTCSSAHLTLGQLSLTRPSSLTSTPASAPARHAARPALPSSPTCPRRHVASSPNLQPLLQPAGAQPPGRPSAGGAGRGGAWPSGHGSRLRPSHAAAWPLGRSGPGNFRAGRPGLGPCLPPPLPLDAEPDAGSDVSAHLSWLWTLCSSGRAGARRPLEPRAEHSASQQRRDGEPRAEPRAVSWGPAQPPRPQTSRWASWASVSSREHDSHACRGSWAVRPCPTVTQAIQARAARPTPCIAQNMAPAPVPGRPS